ncbi:UNVERIFIED_CONTAM: hypothetical protein GTU68_041223 [Idotea baltica]|nr:hypothetical protein [Idotea baltica]
MSANTFGTIFKIMTFGESHGRAIGVTIDGCPSGVRIDEEAIQRDLDRRRPGQSAIVTQRKEGDKFQILSGVFEGKSTGTPIALVIFNEDQRSKDYSHIAEKFRPSHADYTYQEKYGHRDYRGGGRSSARETAARVAAGAIAKMLLKDAGIEIMSYVSQVGHLRMESMSEEITPDSIEKNVVRCPDAKMAHEMETFIKSVKKDGDTVGGVVTGIIKGSPVGLGAPAFDKLHADLGKAMLSINACKGFEYGSGFAGVSMRGSQHNDLFENIDGGIQGGISNGMDINFRVAFKPVATIMKPQGKGRHDPCVVPRAVAIVDAMAAIVMADHLLRARLDKI